MKVIIINGSPRKDGNTSIAVGELDKVFRAEGIETEIIQIGNMDIRGCIGCASCKKNGKCVFDDIVNETAAKFKDADGLVVASPVYYASANGTVVSFMDRLFYSSGFDKTMKVGASVAVARRGGCSATFDQLNKSWRVRPAPYTAAGLPHTSWNAISSASKARLNSRAARSVQIMPPTFPSGRFH